MFHLRPCYRFEINSQFFPVIQLLTPDSRLVFDNRTCLIFIDERTGSTALSPGNLLNRFWQTGSLFEEHQFSFRITTALTLSIRTILSGSSLISTIRRRITANRSIHLLEAVSFKYALPSQVNRILSENHYRWYQKGCCAVLCYRQYIQCIRLSNIHFIISNRVRTSSGLLKTSI